MQRQGLSGDGLDRRHAVASGLFFGAAGALALSTVLPWVSVPILIASVDVRPSGGLVLYVLLFAAAYAWVGFRVRQSGVPLWLVIVTWVVNGWMVLNVVGIFAAFADQDEIITASPASGVFVASAGVLAAVVATVQLNLARSGRTGDAPLAWAQRSPDGAWWWDGQRWREVPRRSPQPVNPSPTPSAPGHFDASGPPAGAQVSPDGAWWWDGQRWREVSRGGGGPELPFRSV